MITKYINTWTLNKWQSDVLYTIVGLLYPKKITKGDRIECHGIGYPHWKGLRFDCTCNFNDGTIGIRNSVRVNIKDFKKIKK
jgi:hypothetical protein